MNVFAACFKQIQRCFSHAGFSVQLCNYSCTSGLQKLDVSFLLRLTFIKTPIVHSEPRSQSAQWILVHCIPSLANLLLGVFKFIFAPLFVEWRVLRKKEKLVSIQKGDTRGSRTKNKWLKFERSEQNV